AVWGKPRPVVNLSGPLGATMLTNGGVIRRCDVDQPELHALPALPLIDRKAARGMNPLATAFEKRAAEFLAVRAKRNGVDGGTVAGAQACAHMRVPHRIRINDQMRR